MSDRTPQLQAMWVRVVDRSGRVRLEERWTVPQRAKQVRSNRGVKQAA